MVHLGFMFAKGYGVKHNSNTAFNLFRNSLEQPDTPDVAANTSYAKTIFYWLGKLTETGKGVEKNITDAIAWYKRGARLGCTSCNAALVRLAGR